MKESECNVSNKIADPIRSDALTNNSVNEYIRSEDLHLHPPILLSRGSV